MAEKLTKFLGRKIEHVRVSSEEVVKVYMNAWFPEPAAKFMSFVESWTAQGKEEALKSDAVRMATAGSSGLTFDEFLKDTTW